MRYANFPAYTITGALATNTELNSRALLISNANASTPQTVTFSAEVWETVVGGTRDQEEYGDYTGRQYKNLSFVVSLRPAETLVLPLSLKKVNTSGTTIPANVNVYVLV